MDSNSLQQCKSILIELNQLANRITTYFKEQSNGEGYIYSTTYSGWVQEYNKLIQKCNALMDTVFSTYVIKDYELSSTRKTVRTEAVKAFAQSVSQMKQYIQTEIENRQSKADVIPENQMRVCFKTGVRGCPWKPSENRNKVFVAMPFSDDYRDIYEYGIKLALEKMGMEHFKADNEISNKDIMCKICKEIQTCGTVIANISGLNPNVMLELGLAYGLGKKVIVIKDKKTTAISDLGSVEYIEYGHAGDLQRKLPEIL